MIVHVCTLTSFSESPLHLLTMEEADMLKKVVLHSVATALANIVLPVPAHKAPGGNHVRSTYKSCTILTMYSKIHT